MAAFKANNKTITKKEINNYNEEKMQRAIDMKNEIVFEYDYSSDTYTALAYNGYNYYKI